MDNSANETTTKKRLISTIIHKRTHLYASNHQKQDRSMKSCWISGVTNFEQQLLVNPQNFRFNFLLQCAMKSLLIEKTANSNN